MMLLNFLSALLASREGKKDAGYGLVELMVAIFVGLMCLILLFYVLDRVH